MAANREATGLAALRVCLGVFLLAESYFKLRWLLNAEALTTKANDWARNANHYNEWALHHLLLPYVSIWSRAIMLGEVCLGLGLLLGVFTRPLAIVAFLGSLAFCFLTGILFHVTFLIDGLGLPLVGATLALAIGGGRLPWSLRG
jgi:uncharacterized membrane protein YphA (DoxX/SURF4 family)